VANAMFGGIKILITRIIDVDVTWKETVLVNPDMYVRCRNGYYLLGENRFKLSRMYRKRGSKMHRSQQNVLIFSSSSSILRSR